MSAELFLFPRTHIARAARARHSVELTVRQSLYLRQARRNIRTAALGVLLSGFVGGVCTLMSATFAFSALGAGSALLAVFAGAFMAVTVGFVYIGSLEWRELQTQREEYRHGASRITGLGRRAA